MPVLGLISIVLVVLAWRGRLRGRCASVVVRLLSALAAVPAFLERGVPAGPMALRGFSIGLTVIGAALMLAGLRRPALVSAQ